jgi:hypothetical protein
MDTKKPAKSSFVQFLYKIYFIVITTDSLDKNADNILILQFYSVTMTNKLKYLSFY